MYDDDMRQAYNEGYEAGKANGVNAVLGDGWRDARKELPEEEKRILLYSECFGECIFVCGYWNGLSYKNDLYKTENGAIAWRPLPDPPAFA
jgi:hypothetical protein